MAIISGARASNKEKLKVEISAEIIEKIRNYCEWANISSIDYFIEEAACFVFAKDKEWKAHHKSVKRANKNKTGVDA
jgi:hypothetical protein